MNPNTDAAPLKTRTLHSADPARRAPAAAPSRPAPLAGRRIAWYLALTFGITWTLWITVGLATGAFANGISSSPVMMAATAVGMFVPLIGALGANAIAGARGHGRRDLALRPHIRGNVRLYAAAWLLPALFTLAGGALFFALVPASFDAGMPYVHELMAAAPPESQVPAEQIPLVVAALIVSAIVVAPFINMIPAFGEEAGWRGMLWPALAERFSERTAVLVSGVIWGLWHAPITMMGHNYGMDYPGWPILGIACMCVFCTCAGSCLAYLRKRSGSVWPCALAHGAINAVANVGIYFNVAALPLLGPAPTGLIGCIPVALVGLWCWLKLSGEKPRR